MIYYNEGKNLVKIWSNEVEDSAMKQIKNLSNLPFGFHHLAMMPDNHTGFGCPIGTVFASKDVIVPAIVGVDIGCGMCAVKTSLKEIDQEALKKIMGETRKQIPLGFGHHKDKQDSSLMPDKKGAVVREGFIIEQEYQNALTQLGTLGGGNHFIEIQKGDDGFIWLMIHSGSRNFGFKVADYYNKLAVKINDKWHSKVPKEWELAFLPLDSQEGQDYMEEMKYCVDFALANRQLMMDRLTAIVYQLTKANFESMINIAHNYATMENHYGENVLVHRKGATKADKGLTGIIPGSMGTSSYIIEGLGNPESFRSCSHGAGRRMGRKEAIRTLNLEEEQKKMEGILGKPRSQNDLEEAPGAYKDIDEVMENQSDLVKIKTKLKPLAVIKG